MVEEERSEVAFPPLLPERFEDEGDTREDIDDAQLMLSHNITAVAVDPRIPDNVFTAFMDSIESEPPPKLPETRLPNVEAAEFAPYLHSIAEGYAKYVSDHGSGSHAESADGGRAGFANALARAEAAHSDAAGAFLSTADGIHREAPTPIGGADIARVFDEVPEVFFRKDFSLSSPDTFRMVTELATPMVLDEKLSHYLDLVEVCLLTQISKRSGAFFRALVELREFKDDVARACLLVNNLRAYLRSLRRRVVAGSLRVLRLRRRRANALALQRTLRRVDELRAAGESVRGLLERGAFQAALAAIEEAQGVLSGELAGLRCIGPIARQLAEYKSLLVETVAGRFLTLAVTWEPEEEEADGGGGGGGGGGDGAAWTAEKRREHAQALETQLLPLAEGLVVAGALPPSALLQRYRQRTTEELTGLVKTVVSTSLASLLPQQGAQRRREGARIGKQLRALDAAAFCSLLRLVMGQLRLVMLRAHAAQSVIQHALDVLRQRTERFEAAGEESGDGEAAAGSGGDARADGSGDPGGGSGGVGGGSKSAVLRAWEHEALSREVQETTEHVWRLAQRHLTKMLEVREEANIALPLPSLRALWRLLRGFADDVEAMTALRGEHLLSTVLSQARQHLERDHAAGAARLRAALEQEEWRAVPVTHQAQESVDAISLASRGQQPPSPQQQQQQARGEATDGESNGGPAPDGAPRRTLVGRAARTLRVAGRRYPAVASALVLVDLVAGLLGTLAEFPSMAADVFARALELLRLFNARSTQLVLGAGAVTRPGAKLRTISARHLAVLSQSLRAVMALSPTLRAAFAQHLPARQHLLLQQLDRVTRDYADHVSKIAAKFVSILRELIRDHCGPSLRAVDWEAAAAGAGGAQPSAPMRELIANTTRLHSVLGEVLDAGQVRDVFGRAVSMFEVALPEAFASVDPTPMSAGARRALLADVGHLGEALRGVGLDSAGALILVHFQSRFGAGLGELRAPAATACGGEGGGDGGLGRGADDSSAGGEQAAATGAGSGSAGGDEAQQSES